MMPSNDANAQVKEKEVIELDNYHSTQVRNVKSSLYGEVRDEAKGQ